ncbi:MAG: squalene/phytoene synthase family protein [Alphaproteobacteria bacterium]|nr:squalene/phytoene synthase family protein [Alphaproteobacteria bacterium]
MRNEKAKNEKEIAELVKQSGSSFYWAMRFLSKEKRNAMFAVYAFCRIIDDIADEPAPIEEKSTNLKFWRNEIDKIYKGEEPEHFVSKDLVYYVKKFNLPKEEFIALIDGMEMDIPDGMCAPSFSELQLYTRRVAGAVGVLSVYIFGDSSQDAIRYALTLGDAVQITNILRDMHEDMELGRLYIPNEYLEDVGIKINDNSKLSDILNNKNIGLIREKLANEAFTKFSEANFLLNKINKRAMKPAVIMGNAYFFILKKLEKRGLDILLPRVRTPKLVLFLSALKISLFGI